MSDNEEKDAIFGYSDDEVESQNDSLCSIVMKKKTKYRELEEHI